MTLNPPPGKRLVRDWTGMRVRTLAPLKNYYAGIEAGTVATVSSAGKTGITLRTDKCACCGIVIYITRVSDRDVQPIEEGK